MSNSARALGIGHNSGNCAVCPLMIAAAQRSDAEHQLFFGYLGMVRHNWPEQFKFQPDDTEHLRAWALVEVGHTVTLAVAKTMSRDDVISLGLFFCDGKRHFRVFDGGDHYTLVRPRSIARAKCNVKTFRDVAAKVYDLLQSITGISPEDYKREQEARHGSQPVRRDAAHPANRQAEAGTVR